MLEQQTNGPRYPFPLWLFLPPGSLYCGVPDLWRYALDGPRLDAPAGPVRSARRSVCLDVCVHDLPHCRLDQTTLTSGQTVPQRLVARLATHCASQRYLAIHTLGHAAPLVRGLGHFSSRSFGIALIVMPWLRSLTASCWMLMVNTGEASAPWSSLPRSRQPPRALA